MLKIIRIGLILRVAIYENGSFTTFLKRNVYLIGWVKRNKLIFMKMLLFLLCSIICIASYLKLSGQKIEVLEMSIVSKAGKNFKRTRLNLRKDLRLNSKI